MRYFKRSPSTSTFEGVDFPENMLEKVTLAFNDHFENVFPHSTQDKSFHAFGKIFADEILLIVSLVHDKNLSSPITLFLSKDISEKDMQNPPLLKKSLEIMVELADVFFDSMLETLDWSDFSLAWSEENYNGEIFYAKTTRENIDLTLEANRLLGDSFDEDFDSLAPLSEDEVSPKN